MKNTAFTAKYYFYYGYCFTGNGSVCRGKTQSGGDLH